MNQVLMFVRDPWNILGMFGQALFASRFVIQWFKSEMEGRSIIPVAFWYCSLGGGVMLLAYAIYRDEPVFIAGQGLGLIVYLRNLWLIFHEKKRARLTVEVETPRH
jgi:lipid-A-disaccharide synthase-like uncharacterized protein